MRIGYDCGFFDIRGLSTDTKPAANATLSSNSAAKSNGVLYDASFTRTLDVGDSFYEIDTKKLYMFDGSTWREQ